jgi:hypothetical protein
MQKHLSYAEKFKLLQDHLLAAFQTFEFWKTLQNPENQTVYNKNPAFWNTVFRSMQESWFMGLARIFEDSQYSESGKVLSVFGLVEEHPNQVRAQEARNFISENSAAIANINRIRDHHYAHNNTKHLADPSVLMERFPLKNEEIIKIFHFSDKLLSLLHPDDGNGYVLDHIQDEARRDANDVVAGLKYFNEKRDAHFEDTLNGKGFDFKFPPAPPV